MEDCKTMKKALKTITLAAVIIAALILAYKAGIRHAIEDSVIWTVDLYNPDDPESSAWNGYDQLIYINLDGELYEHGMIQC